MERGWSYKSRPMSANHLEVADRENSDRDRMLRRLIGCFAAASFVALGMAVTMAAWQRPSADAAPVSLAQDAAH